MSSTAQRKLWDGKIPVCFTLADHELTSAIAPQPMFALISRVSYITLHNQMMREHFASFVDGNKTEQVWYEYKGQPLKWNLPTGVLFDMHCHEPAKDLPWSITVHFQSFPKSVLMSCECEEAIQSSFLSALKEADFLKHSGEVVNAMSRDQHMRIWHGIKTHNFEQFWSVNKMFMNGYQEGMSFQSVPVKVYYEKRILQRRVGYEDKNMTLRGCLQSLDKELFSDERINTLNIVLQGIRPTLDCNLQWLSENLCYPDNFLHLCVHNNS